MTQNTKPLTPKDRLVESLLGLCDYLIKNPGPIDTRAASYLARIEDIEEAHRALSEAEHG